MLKRLRDGAYHYRGYRGFNTLDRLSLAGMAIGGVAVLVSFLLDSAGIGGLGLFLVIIGLLTLIRHFPGDGG